MAHEARPPTTDSLEEDEPAINGQITVANPSLLSELVAGPRDSLDVTAKTDSNNNGVESSLSNYQYVSSDVEDDIPPVISSTQSTARDYQSSEHQRLSAPDYKPTASARSPIVPRASSRNFATDSDNIPPLKLTDSLVADDPAPGTNKAAVHDSLDSEDSMCSEDFNRLQNLMNDKPIPKVFDLYDPTSTALTPTTQSELNISKSLANNLSPDFSTSNQSVSSLSVVSPLPIEPEQTPRPGPTAYQDDTTPRYQPHTNQITYIQPGAGLNISKTHQITYNQSTQNNGYVQQYGQYDPTFNNSTRSYNEHYGQQQAVDYNNYSQQPTVHYNQQPLSPTQYNQPVHQSPRRRNKMPDLPSPRHSTRENTTTTTTTQRDMSPNRLVGMVAPKPPRPQKNFIEKNVDKARGRGSAKGSYSDKLKKKRETEEKLKEWAPGPVLQHKKAASADNASRPPPILLSPRHYSSNTQINVTAIQENPAEISQVWQHRSQMLSQAKTGKPISRQTTMNAPTYSSSRPQAWDMSYTYHDLPPTTGRESQMTDMRVKFDVDLTVAPDKRYPNPPHLLHQEPIRENASLILGRHIHEDPMLIYSPESGEHAEYYAPGHNQQENQVIIHSSVGNNHTRPQHLQHHDNSAHQVSNKGYKSHQQTHQQGFSSHDGQQPIQVHQSRQQAPYSQHLTYQQGIKHSQQSIGNYQGHQQGYHSEHLTHQQGIKDSQQPIQVHQGHAHHGPTLQHGIKNLQHHVGQQTIQHLQTHQQAPCKEYYESQPDTDQQRYGQHHNQSEVIQPQLEQSLQRNKHRTVIEHSSTLPSVHSRYPISYLNNNQTTQPDSQSQAQNIKTEAEIIALLDAEEAIRGSYDQIYRQTHQMSPTQLQSNGTTLTEGNGYLDMYQNNKDDPLNPYPNIPPIGSADSQCREKERSNKKNKTRRKNSTDGEEGGYSQAFKAQKEKFMSDSPTYQKYTLEDYKKINTDVKLGGLGPTEDPQVLKAKQETRMKQLEFARRARELVQTQNPSSNKKKMATKKPSSRQKMLEFSKTIPKPKVMSRSNSVDNVQTLDLGSLKFDQTPRATIQSNRSETTQQNLTARIANPYITQAQPQAVNEHSREDMPQALQDYLNNDESQRLPQDTQSTQPVFDLKQLDTIEMLHKRHIEEKQKISQIKLT